MKTSLLIFISIFLLPVSLLARDEDDDSHSNVRWNVQAGSWYPLGKLTEHFKPGLYIGGKMALLRNKNSGFHIDCSSDFIFPSTHHKFDFNDGIKPFPVKALLIWDMSVYFRRESRISKDVFWGKYIGFGVNILFTDEAYTSYRDYEKEYYDAYNDEYYTESSTESFTFLYNANAASFGIGMNLRLKRTGIFLEYNYVLYRTNPKLANDFGHSYLKMGVNVWF